MRLTQRRRQGLPIYIDTTLDSNQKLELWRVNWKQWGYSYCGLYAVCPDNAWPTKIGISQNPVKRLISIQTSVWKRVDIFDYRYFENSIQAREVEKKSHELMAADGLSMMGEWFDIRPDKAMEIVDFAASLLGYEAKTEVPNDERIKQAMTNMAWKNYGRQVDDKEAVGFELDG